MPIKSDNTNED